MVRRWASERVGVVCGLAGQPGGGSRLSALDEKLTRLLAKFESARNLSSSGQIGVLRFSFDTPARRGHPVWQWRVSGQRAGQSLPVMINQMDLVLPREAAAQAVRAAQAAGMEASARLGLAGRLVWLVK